MFAVGVNSSTKDFIEAINRPGAIFAGYIGQYFVKPLLGFLFGTISVTVFHLPASLGEELTLYHLFLLYDKSALLNEHGTLNQVLGSC